MPKAKRYTEKRFVILTPAQARQLERLSQHQEVSVPELIRTAIRQHWPTDGIRSAGRAVRHQGTATMTQLACGRILEHILREDMFELLLAIPLLRFVPTLPLRLWNEERTIERRRITNQRSAWVRARRPLGATCSMSWRAVIAG